MSAILACIGISSQISMPGTLVLIGLNSPRYSRGASGFMSYMSRCDGPPLKKIMMIDLCRPPAGHRRVGPQPQHVAQRQPTQGQPAHAQEAAAGEHIAKRGAMGSMDRRHTTLLSLERARFWGAGRTQAGRVSYVIADRTGGLKSPPLNWGI